MRRELLNILNLRRFTVTQMTTMRSSFAILVIILLMVTNQATSNDDDSCLLGLTDLTSEYQPILTLSNRVNEFIYPAHTSPGSIYLQRGQSVRLVCPYSNLVVNNVTFENSVAFLECYNNTGYLLDGMLTGTFGLEEIECLKPVQPQMRTQGGGRPCHEEFCYSVGVLLTPFDYVELLNLEFAKNFTRVSSYTFLHPAVAGRQEADAKDVKYKRGSYYSQFPVDPATMFAHGFQKQLLTKDLGIDPEYVERYLPKDESDYLTEAPLITSDDYYYVVQQKSTLFYENVVPMWRSIREGNWRLVDRAVRKLAREISTLPSLVIAGTIDTLSLPATGTPPRRSELLLRPAASAGSSEPIIAVPRIVFKIVYEPTSRKGLVFLTVNDPHVTMASLDLLVCHPVDYCESMYPAFAVPAQGYTYCCTIQEFIHCCYGNRLHEVHVPYSLRRRRRSLGSAESANKTGDDRGER